MLKSEERKPTDGDISVPNRMQQLETELSYMKGRVESSEALIDYYRRQNEVLSIELLAVKEKSNDQRKQKAMPILKDAAVGPDQPHRTSDKGEGQPTCSPSPVKRKRISKSPCPVTPLTQVTKDVEEWMNTNAVEVHVVPWDFKPEAINRVSIGMYSTLSKNVLLDSRGISLFSVSSHTDQKEMNRFNLVVPVTEMKQVRFHFLKNSVSVRILVISEAALKIQQGLVLKDKDKVLYDVNHDQKEVRYMSVSLFLPLRYRKTFVSELVTSWCKNIGQYSVLPGSDISDDCFLYLARSDFTPFGTSSSGFTLLPH